MTSAGQIDDEEQELPSASRRPGSDATLERLRAKILSGELPPGSVISQTRLARELGVSTTPLREVIRQLQAEGLMSVEFNRRPRVAPLNVEDLNGIYAGRIMLESLAISLTVPAATDAELDDIQADLTEMKRLMIAQELGEWSVVHRRFHRRLLVGIPPAMASTMTSFANRAERYRQRSDQRGDIRALGDGDREHQRIVDACLAREARTAAVELANHLARAALYHSAALAPESDPRAVRLAVGMVTHSTAASPCRMSDDRSDCFK